MSEKRAVFFCSASKEIDPKYNQAARDAVRAACLAGYDIVSGGTIKGTMEVVAHEASLHDVQNIGILPEFMRGLEYPGLTQTIWVKTMSERKELLREGANLVVALPGGIGTLDELAETYTLVKLARMDAKLLVYDYEGFYAPLEALMDHYVATGMLDRESRALLKFVRNQQEFEKEL